MKNKVKPLDRYQVSCFQEIFVDLFAGGGGASMGIEQGLGLPVFAAVNHDPDAIAQHAANHKWTKHYQTSVWDVDPETICEGRPVGLLWASPDCKHFSKARGGKPVNKNIRSLSWVVLKWALEVRPRVLMMENVEEIQTWGPLIYVKRGNKKVWVPDPDHAGETFMAFIGMLTTGVPEDHPALEEACHYLHVGKDDPRRQKLIDGLGYQVEHKELVAADFDAPTTRKRFMLCGRCDGKPIVWPQRTNAPRNSEEVKSGKLKPWRSAAEIIDWSLPSYSIFDTKQQIKEKYGVNAIRPLADNTMKRVICGVDKHSIKSAKPFIIQQKFNNVAQDIDNPLSTITSVGSHELVSPVITPFGVECNHSGGGHIHDLREPLNTITGKHTGGMAQSVMVPWTVTNTSNSIGSPASEPVHTITSAGNQILAEADLRPVKRPFGRWDPEQEMYVYTEDEEWESDLRLMRQLAQEEKEEEAAKAARKKEMLHAANLIQYHSEKDSEVARTADLRKPIPTIDAANRHGLVTAQLVEYYGNGQSVGVGEPLHTVTSHDRDALALVHIQKYFSGGYTGCGDDAGAPLSTITALPRHGVCAAHVVKFKGQELGTSPADPLPTVTAQANCFAECRAVLIKVDDSQSLGHWPKIRALLNKYCGYHLEDDEVILLIIRGIAYFIADILLRMLTPRELYNAMGFPPDYVIDVDYRGKPYPKSKQVARCGNAVCPPMARAMVQANFPEYCVVDVSTLAQFHKLVSL